MLLAFLTARSMGSSPTAKSVTSIQITSDRFCCMIAHAIA
jgi:hypothetical protein